MPPKLDDKSPTARIYMLAPEAWVARIDEWRAQRRPIPTRSEAIRLLVDEALEAADADTKPPRNKRPR